jgi:dihydrofolate reductase
MSVNAMASLQRWRVWRIYTPGRGKDYCTIRRGDRGRSGTMARPPSFIRNWRQPMRRIIYSFSVTLDGYIEGPSGDMAWAYPEEELHRAFNAMEDGIDMHIYGRRTWEGMANYWPTADENPEAPPWEAEYARIWRSKRKVVYSRSLESVEHGAQLVRRVDPAEVAAWKAEPGLDISIAGAELAAEFMAHDLIDQYHVVVCPVLLGGGKPMFAGLASPLPLRLIDTRTYRGQGMVWLHYERARE